MAQMELQTEFTFTLPCGYVDERGTLHRQGTMRRATALDELAPLQDARVRANESYVAVMILSRVITRLGTLESVEPAMVERIFATDFIFLQELYLRINGATEELIETECPTCHTRFMLNLAERHGHS